MQGSKGTQHGHLISTALQKIQNGLCWNKNNAFVIRMEKMVGQVTLFKDNGIKGENSILIWIWLSQGT